MLRQRKVVAAVGENLSEKEAPSPSSPTKNSHVEEVIQALPEAVFKQSSRKALRTLLLTVGFLVIGYYMLYKFPWYLLPVGWSFVGFCAAGLFAVGCACGEEKFFNKENMPSWVNTLTGATCMGILLYPFEQFKLQHNNNKYTLAKCSGYLIESPLWFITSIFEFFSANVYWENKKSVVINAVALYAFAGLFFSIMTYSLGLLGLFKYYIMPLIFYHVIMSIFLKVNDMAWKDSKLPSLPRLVEFLSNNANHQYAIRVHWKDTEEVQQDISDAVASLIPNYNLHAARNAIREKFGQIYEQSFSFSTIRDLFTKYKPLPELDLETGAYCILSPLLSLYGALFCTWYWKTWLLSFLGYYIGGIGITAGYHRLFSHRSYEANKFVRYLMAFIGVSTFQGPILKWCSDHRIHHRFTDTDKDPYNIKRGFFYAHMGWLFLKRPTEPVGVDDLKQDPVIMWQWNHYTPLAVFFGYILPMLIAGLGWGDWKGGFLIGGVLSKTFLHHCTFFINSLAHTWGEATFTDGRSPRDSYIVSLFTFGEGYHNFHHEFPFDYRNGLLWYHYDPGKWLIWLFEKLGWAWDLKKFDPELFEKGRIQMFQKKLDIEKKKYDWGTPIESLPVISAEEYKKRAPKEQLVLIDGVAHAAGSFLDKHPPGPAFIKAFIGKDATQAFNGLSYNHSNAARNVLPKLRAYKVENTASISTEGDNMESSEIIA